MKMATHCKEVRSIWVWGWSVWVQGWPSRSHSP